MLNKKKYVILSLELHLFFARIMKEHSLFLEAGFTPKNAELAREADRYKKEFEQMLYEVVKLSNGIIRPMVLESGEIFTPYTLTTEQKTQNFTGIAINKNITVLEQSLYSENYPYIPEESVRSVKRINMKAKRLITGLIQLKTKVLNGMLSCTLFTVNYPLLIKHIIREANLYLSYVTALENGKDIDSKNFYQVELFWNQIMMEHALFIRGLLDPSEDQLIETANQFANEYESLLKKTQGISEEKICDLAEDTFETTLAFQEFKKAGTDGIDQCKIQSIILPLLADHVFRESNHYIRLLKTSPCVGWMKSHNSMKQNRSE